MHTNNCAHGTCGGDALLLASSATTRKSPAPRRLALSSANTGGTQVMTTSSIRAPPRGHRAPVRQAVGTRRGTPKRKLVGDPCGSPGAALVTYAAALRSPPQKHLPTPRPHPHPSLTRPPRHRPRQVRTLPPRRRPRRNHRLPHRHPPRPARYRRYRRRCRRWRRRRR